ncbi:helix-turn-helix transcriptional regulator [Nisaea acidiphila]|uniref:Helix-turn-helix transcriptional regulator n=1 Tax=Nisaea acidiphila TaxID=1862145 RepID=A0A9J7B037_9PROT|nr:helix-turn-helix transcriptional regulator [Nisaea acidiphila]UUX51852.1 helix-turn-helix transcriptional regulator [Nisaea acidiphila]
MEGLAGRLREARQQLGLTQAKLAERFGIPYRTVQDGELGHSTPGARVLAAYAQHNVDVNWLLTGKRISDGTKESEPKARKSSAPIKGRNFRIRSRRVVQIPHYDPFDPDSFDPDKPDSVLSITPSRLTAYSIDYAILGREDAELATTTVIDESTSGGLKKGTLVLFDTSVREKLPAERYIVRDGKVLTVSTKEHLGPDQTVLGRIAYALTPQS